MSSAGDHLSALIRQRRSVRDFRRTPIPNEVLYAVLDDANWSPSWSNTQPYRIAIASGPLRDQLAEELTARFDAGMRAIAGGLFGKVKAFVARKGLPDGDVKVDFEYPEDLLERRRATGYGLYKLLGIAREDRAGRNAQMRRNFEFFGAPTVVFVFVHKGLREFSALDAGIFLQTFMLSAEANGLATCAQGALATWAGPVRAAFDVPAEYNLLCGISVGFASEHKVNTFNPGRADIADMVIPTRESNP
jgi:nitroreductase